MKWNTLFPHLFGSWPVAKKQNLVGAFILFSAVCELLAVHPKRDFSNVRNVTEIGKKKKKVGKKYLIKKQREEKRLNLTKLLSLIPQFILWPFRLGTTGLNYWTVYKVFKSSYNLISYNSKLLLTPWLLYLYWFFWRICKSVHLVRII